MTSGYEAVTHDNVINTAGSLTTTGPSGTMVDGCLMGHAVVILMVAVETSVENSKLMWIALSYGFALTILITIYLYIHEKFTCDFSVIQNFTYMKLMKIYVNYAIDIFNLETHASREVCSNSVQINDVYPSHDMVCGLRLWCMLYHVRTRIFSGLVRLA